MTITSSFSSNDPIITGYPDPGALAGAGLKAIGSTLNENIPISVRSEASSLTQIGEADRATLIIWTGTTSPMVQLPDVTTSTIQDGFTFSLSNQGAGTQVTLIPYSNSGVSPAIQQTINGGSALVLEPATSLSVFSDGSQGWYTLSGIPSDPSSLLNADIYIPPSGNTPTYTESPSDMLSQIQTFTGGSLTSPTYTIIIPSTQPFEYFIINQTSNDLVFQTSLSSSQSVTIPKPSPTQLTGAWAILVSNGTNLYVDTALNSFMSTVGDMVYCSASATLNTPATVSNLPIGAQNQVLQVTATGINNALIPGWGPYIQDTVKAVSLGQGALAVNTGLFNTAVGSGALQNNVANANTAAGYYALNANTGGSQNTAIGYQALYNSNTSVNPSVAVGFCALYSNTTGVQNTALGTNALYSNTTAGQNVAIGDQALYSNTGASLNTAVGFEALQYSTTDQNTAVGWNALVRFGKNIGVINPTSHYNTAVGANALAGSPNGINEGGLNTAIGVYAGHDVTLHTGMTFLGAGSNVGGSISNLTNATAIGYGATVSNSNSLVLGGTYTNYDSNWIQCPYPNVGIGQNNPQASLHISNTGGQNNEPGGTPAVYTNQVCSLQLDPTQTNPTSSVGEQGACLYTDNTSLYSYVGSTQYNLTNPNIFLMSSTGAFNFPATPTSNAYFEYIIPDQLVAILKNPNNNQNYICITGGLNLYLGRTSGNSNCSVDFGIGMNGLPQPTATNTITLQSNVSGGHDLTVPTLYQQIGFFSNKSIISNGLRIYVTPRDTQFNIKADYITAFMFVNVCSTVQP